MLQLLLFLVGEALLMVSYSPVISWVDCCNAFYIGLPLKCIWKLQVAENAMVQVVKCAPRMAHVAPLLCKLY